MPIRLTDKVTFSKRRKNKQGFLEARDSVLARTGILRYSASELGLTDRDPDEMLNIYRSPEALFNKATMDSFKSVAMTSRHPKDFITADNARDFAVGLSKDDISRSGQFLTGTLLVLDGNQIQKIEDDEEVELSLGYEADIEMMDGVSPEGVAFDGVQTNIIGNHIAVVPCGRCGDRVRISDEQKTKSEEASMETVKMMVDGVEIEMTKQGAQAFDKISKKLADAETESKEKKEEMDQEAEEKEKEHKDALSVLQAELDDAKSKILTDEQIDERIQERSDLMSNARKVLGDSADFSGKSNEEIKTMVVKEGRKAVTDEQLSNRAYVDASFDLLIEDSKTGNGHQAFQDHANNMQVEDEKGSLSEEARKKRIKDNQNAWKPKTEETK
jgi:hypothetical protein